MILIKNLDLIATFDDNDLIVRNGSILIDGPSIFRIADHGEEDLQADEVIDGRGKMALPGFVNTHHHFFQQLTRAVPQVHCSNILEWLEYLYPLWSRMDAEATYNAGLLACTELLLTGCTTTADMAYFYPFGRTDMFDAAVKAASDIGIRFHPCRAAMPAMEADIAGKLSARGFPVEQLVEDPEVILSECERVIGKYNRAEKYSMCRVALGQTDKTYRQPDFMRQMADLARKNNVMLHTHLHPRPDEIALCKQLYGMEPIDFLEQYGWLGSDVWFGHATNFSPYYVERVGATRTGISHSPSSNMRLNFSCTPIPALIAAGAKVSVGVDGGASNDSGDYLGELREVLYVHRIRGIHPDPFNSASNTTPYGVLRLGTRGGADVLNRPEIGSLEVGKAADIAIFNLNRVDFAAVHDPLAALIMCGISHRVDTTIVNGKILVKDGLLTVLDENEIADRANKSAIRLFKEE